MNTFVTALSIRVESYIALQHALGYQFHKQAASLRHFCGYVHGIDSSGPLSQPLAVDFVMPSDLTFNGGAIRYGVIRRFSQYYAAFDPHTGSFDRRALPRSRNSATPRGPR
jgi:hypothetical protein